MEVTANNKLSTDEVLAIVVRCMHFAATKHSFQRRNDHFATPYINHPIGVANILIEEGGVREPIVILAAVLHDTVEDTDTTFDDLEKEFGAAVCSVVREVTDDKELSKLERKRLQVESAPNRSREAKLVTLADKLYNLRDIVKGPPVGWSLDRVNEYFKWAKTVIDGCRGTNSQLEQELDVIFNRYLEQNNIGGCPSTVPTSML